MLDLRAGNAQWRGSCGAAFVDVGVSVSMVGWEYPEYSAHPKRLAVADLAER